MHRWSRLTQACRDVACKTLVACMYAGREGGGSGCDKKTCGDMIWFLLRKVARGVYST